MNGIGVSAVTAYTAHREWASRPPDERYASVPTLYDAARARRLRTEERTIDTVDVRTEAVAPNALALRDTSGRQSALTHWSFEQLAGICAQLVVSLLEDPNPLGVASRTEGMSSADVQDAKPCRP